PPRSRPGRSSSTPMGPAGEWSFPSAGSRSPATGGRSPSKPSTSTRRRRPSPSSCEQTAGAAVTYSLVGLVLIASAACRLLILGLVLIASVAHALCNLAAKSVTGKGYAFVLAYHGLSAILLIPVAIVIIASGAKPLNWALVAAAALSAVSHIAYSVSLQSGYDHAPLGVVYPTARGKIGRAHV